MLQVQFLHRHFVSSKDLGPWNIAANDDQSYTYHSMIFKDIDNDGLKDAFGPR